MRTRSMLILLMWVALGFYSGSSWARGGGHDHRHGYSHRHDYGRGRFGLYLGIPYYPYPYYDFPYRYPYYPPTVITVPATPPVYIQQSPPADEQQDDASGYWHYCTNPEGYYPYIKECPGGWQLVEPTPPEPH